MAELQNVWGESWHRELNAFLSTILNWSQLGESSTDVIDPHTSHPRGIDSVFSYRRNQNCNQQIILVEAKRIANINNTNRSRLEDWIITLSDKLGQLPSSKEFRGKYGTETGADYGLGLVGLWIEDQTDGTEKKLRTWLSQLRLPEKKPALHIGFISNLEIARLIAIHEEMDRIRHGEDCENISLHMPDYGTLPTTDNVCLPFESLFSRFVFCKAKMRQRLKGSDIGYSLYDRILVFYLDPIGSFEDLYFVGLALRHFQLTQDYDITIYTTAKHTEIRDYIAQFHQKFGQHNSRNEIRFDTLIPKTKIPSWMVSQ